MSGTLTARGLSLSVGDTVLLDAVDLQAAPGWCVGLVGPNGVGKSTLLRVLAGEQAVEAGSVTFAPKDATVGHLPQEPERRADETVMAHLERRTGVGAADRELEAATLVLSNGEPGGEDRYAEALERWLALGAADLESRVGGVWADLGLPLRLLDQPMASLSGGEAARVGLAALLLARFDVFLLDEPTNDLDLDGLARLEAWVGEQDAPVILVSHDRAFLRRTVTHVAELDPFSHRLAMFAGGWESYLTERALAAHHAQQRYEEYADRRDALAGRAQREREWATRGRSRAKRKPSDNDKYVRAFKVDQTEQLAGKAARTERAIDRLEAVDKPREAWELRLTFGEASRGGDVVVRLAGAVASNGGFTLGPIDLTVGVGERIAIVGANGSGKSTLLDVILGRRALDVGSRWMGPGVVVGELEQRRAQLSSDRTLLEEFMDATGMTIPDARTLLAKFGIGAGEVGRVTASLSPGERTRTVLALLMATGTNCLVLDEPTNHLDLPAIEQLERALDGFRGSVLLVTHDRDLLDEVRLTRRIEVRAGRIVADEPV
ncbi:MAG: ABC-F family ATP-binding cassette domain-containing protein [Actinomycetes bacterium]